MILSEQDDNTLVTLTLAGNQKAYEALVIRYQKAVIASAYSVVRNTYMAEDAAQDAFVSAWMKLDMLREADKYSAWVCRIAKNCAKNMLVRFREYLDLDMFLNYEYEHGESLEESLIASGDYNLLHESIDGLSDKVKKVIELHYFEGLSISKIADKLRISAGTVKRQLYDGRFKIRKDLCAMNENENDTLVEKVMKKVRELGTWRLKDNKNGFEEAYNDVLADIDKLPESNKKSWALADVLMQGWWWLPGKKSDELFARIKQAAIDGKNESVMEFVIGNEDEKLSGKDKIDFMLNKQIPFLKENGFIKLIGREWFWLGYEYFKIKDSKTGFAAFNNVLSILEPSDIYYANALSAIEIEKRALEKYKDTDEKIYTLHAIAEEYRFIDGDLRMRSQPGYGKGMLQSVNIGANYIFYNAARCDRYLYINRFKVGDSMTGSDGNTLTFTADNVSFETPCGKFDGCEMWTVTEKSTVYRTYFKRGIGIVRQETTEGDETEVRLLKSFHIEGGDELLPCHAGNRWVYTSNHAADVVDVESAFQMTYADSEKVIFSYYWDIQRLKYDENNWEDMMLQMRNDYYGTRDDGNQFIRDVSFSLEHAKALAKTPLQMTHTKAACSVMQRILDTDGEYSPNRKASGHWNFFHYMNYTSRDGKSMIDDNRKYGFEWKDMGETGDAGFPLLYNHMLGILQDSAGCIWNDDWKDGYSDTITVTGYAKITSEIKCNFVGTITTAAGTFDNCICLSLNAKGFDGGLSYRGGKMSYYFAPGVGIVRATHNFKNDTLVSTYDLTAYEGVGDGYMPIQSGFMRHYDAVGLTDGYVGSIEITYSENKDGSIVVFEDLCGIKMLQTQ